MNDIVGLVKDKFWFFISFIFCKGVVFLTPLLAAEILSKDDFGVLEYALAGLGMILNTSLNLGVPGSYPFYKLKKKEISILEGFELHYIWLLVFFGLIQICYYSVGFSMEYYMALNMAYIISNQVFISTQLKTNDKITRAVFFDSGIYILLIVFIITAYLGFTSKTLDNINFFVIFYSFFYVGYAFFKVLKFNKNIIFKYIKIIKFSYHLLFSTILIFVITVSGRVIVEFFFKDFELVGIYSFYFRLAALVVMIYQVISIAFFKDIYTLDPKTLDKYFALFYVFLFIISMLSFIVSQEVAPHFSSFYRDTIEHYKYIYFVLSAQVIFWIASALFSNIIDRESLAKKITPLFLLIILTFLSCLFIFKTKLTLFSYLAIHFSFIYVSNIFQIFVLYQKGIFFKKSFLILSSIFFITLVKYLVN